jgi:hypothetical protein
MSDRGPFRDNIHPDNYKDFEMLLVLINELADVPPGGEAAFAKRIRAKHYLSNILENVQPINRIKVEEN